jgi:hypothetical protein
VEQIPCEWLSDSRRMWRTSLCFLTCEIGIVCGLESLTSAIPCFVFLFGDHTGNTRSHHPLRLSQERNDHHPQTDWTLDILAVWGPSVHPNLTQISRYLRSRTKLYRPSDRRLSAKLVPTFADRGYRGQRNGYPRSLISVFKTGAATFPLK